MSCTDVPPADLVEVEHCSATLAVSPVLYAGDTFAPRWSCTLPPDHGGEHAAHVPGRRAPVATWGEQ